MKGFDARFGDLPEHVLGVTRTIREGRGIATLHYFRGHAEDIVVRSPVSMAIGKRSVIAAALATLAEFPGRVPRGEDPIRRQFPMHGG